MTHITECQFLKVIHQPMEETEQQLYFILMVGILSAKPVFTSFKNTGC